MAQSGNINNGLQASRSPQSKLYDTSRAKSPNFISNIDHSGFDTRTRVGRENKSPINQSAKDLKEHEGRAERNR